MASVVERLKAQTDKYLRELAEMRRDQAVEIDSLALEAYDIQAEYIAALEKERDALARLLSEHGIQVIALDEKDYEG